MLPVALLLMTLVPASGAPRLPSPAAGYALAGTANAFAGELPVAFAPDDAGDAEQGIRTARVAKPVTGIMRFGDDGATPHAALAAQGITTAPRVNLRRGPGTTHGVVAKLARGTPLAVQEEQDGWYRVLAPLGHEGWISADFVQLDRPPAEPLLPIAPPAGPLLPVAPPAGPTSLAEPTPAPTEEPTVPAEPTPAPAEEPTVPAEPPVATPVPGETPPPEGETPPAEEPPAVEEPVVEAPAPVAAPAEAVPGADAAALARRFIGARYVWGGASPKGFDCSGLTMYVYAQLGVTLPHKASLQFNTRYGARVATLNDLRPGDLVFFVRTTPARGITHVGIYTGNGRMVTANTPRTGVREVSVYDGYWRSRFAGGIRPTR